MKRLTFILVLIAAAVILLAPFQLTVFAETAESESYFLPVVMYHHIMNNRKGTYIVTARQFEQDLIAFKKAGFTTVFPSEVIRYVKGKGTLPNKPLMITFDDGHFNNMYYGLPLLEKHGQKAVINVIGAFSNFSTTSGDDSNPNYSHLTWTQIKFLSKTGYFEIGSHSYNMHKYKPRYGIDKKYGETETQYRKNLTDDIMKLQNKLKEECGVTPVAFAYPFGRYNCLAQEILTSLGFEMTFTCTEGVSTVRKGKTESLYYIKRFNRNSWYSSQELIEKISKVYENG